jgi:hypothetical protein
MACGIERGGEKFILGFGGEMKERDHMEC